MSMDVGGERRETPEGLRRRAEQLFNRADWLKKQLDEQWRQYRAHRDETAPEIGRLEAEADELANQFKALYEESQEAYADGDGEYAKELSLEARELQEECEDFNAEAKALRTELADKRTELDEKKDYIEELRSDAHECLARAKSLGQQHRQLPELNWAGCERLSDGQLRDFLSENIPPEHIRSVTHVSYEHTGQRDLDGRRHGGSSDPVTGKVKIFPPSSDGQPKRELMHVLCHEVGHLVFHDLADEIATAWKDALGVAPGLMFEFHERYPDYSPLRLRREIFSDFYTFYILEGAELQADSSHLYYFLSEHVFQAREYRNVNP